MPLTFEQIPDADRPPTGAPASTVLKDLKATASRRRTVLRGVTLGALTIGAAALDWSGTFGSSKARAEIGPGGLQGWDRNDCRDAFPVGYTEQPDTGGAFAGTYAACFGGTQMGSHFCNSSGWFRHGVFREEGRFGGAWVIYTPAWHCGTFTALNAWRWTTPDGLVYRCSDGYKTVEPDNAIPYTFFAICRAQV